MNKCEIKAILSAYYLVPERILSGNKTPLRWPVNARIRSLNSPNMTLPNWFLHDWPLCLWGTFIGRFIWILSFTVPWTEVFVIIAQFCTQRAFRTFHGFNGNRNSQIFRPWLSLWGGQSNQKETTHPNIYKTHTLTHSSLCSTCFWALVDNGDARQRDSDANSDTWSLRGFTPFPAPMETLVARATWAAAAAVWAGFSLAFTTLDYDFTCTEMNKELSHFWSLLE